jgi:exodeoxyribonuclease V beta subunit
VGGKFKKLHGLMTGAVDLVFVHDHKVYVLDYKSNTLGKTPSFYDEDGMQKCMKDSLYDLQYMIYSTAVHRYFSNYFEERYAFDASPEKELSFGGVFYLFLRGMGLQEKGYPQHGIYFRRPLFSQVDALDKAFLSSRRDG